MEIITHNAQETIDLGKRIGKAAVAGSVIALSGELGAGKTTLTQGIAKGLGVSDYVTSPSFVIISEFKGRLGLCHMDLYRLEHESQIEELGLEDYLDRPESVTVIEWAEKMGSLLPDGAVKISISPLSENKRKFIIEGMDIK